MASKPLRGYVKGLSMWPALIPGDILSANYSEARRIQPGQVVVLKYEGPSPVVHRVVRALSRRDKVFLLTAGDRSGRDSIPTVLEPLALVPVVTGVLRSKRYAGIPSGKHVTRLVPAVFLSIYCALVRRFYWR
jgi:hypothetical protein